MTSDDRPIIPPYMKLGMVFLSFISLALLVYILQLAMDLVIPFVVAVFAYLMLVPILRVLEKGRFPRSLATVITMAVTIFMVLLISQLIYQSIATFTNGLPKYEQRINMIGQELGEFFGVSPLVLSGEQKITDDPRVADMLSGSTITGVLKTLVNSINKMLSYSVLFFLFLLFLLLGRHRMSRKLDHALSTLWSGKITAITESIQVNVQKYLVIKTLVSFLTAGLVMLTAWAFGLDFVVVWGILTFVFNFVPNIGSLIATLLPTLFAGLQFDSFSSIIWLGLVLMTIQFTIGSILEPRLMGKSIDLSPLLILFSLIVWGYIWGIIGMFLSVPIMAIVKIVFDNIEPLRPIAILMGADVKEAKTASP